MKTGYCIHFNGLQNDCCEAGHNYLQMCRPHTTEEIKWHDENYPQFDLADSAISGRMPCNVLNKVSCPDFIEPTPEQVAAYNKEIDDFIADFIHNKLNVVRPAIIAHISQHNALNRDFAGDRDWETHLV